MYVHKSGCTAPGHVAFGEAGCSCKFSSRSEQRRYESQTNSGPYTQRGHLRQLAESAADSLSDALFSRTSDHSLSHSHSSYDSGPHDGGGPSVNEELDQRRKKT